MTDKKHPQAVKNTSFYLEVKKQNTLILDLQNRVAIQKWNKNSTFEEFMEIIDRTLDLIKDKSINKVVSDAKIQSPLKKEEVNYATKALELYFEEGLEKIALITPQSIFNQILVCDFIQNAKEQKAKSFATINEAQNWILEEEDPRLKA